MMIVDVCIFLISVYQEIRKRYNVYEYRRSDRKISRATEVRGTVFIIQTEDGACVADRFMIFSLL
jgi:hypothetical protein